MDPKYTVFRVGSVDNKVNETLIQSCATKLRGFLAEISAGCECEPLRQQCTEHRFVAKLKNVMDISDNRIILESLFPNASIDAKGSDITFCCDYVAMKNAPYKTVKDFYNSVSKNKIGSEGSHQAATAGERRKEEDEDEEDDTEEDEEQTRRPSRNWPLIAFVIFLILILIYGDALGFIQKTR